MRQAAVATDRVVREALIRIARDEQRHAELAWRFVAWATRTGGSIVADKVAQAIESAIVATRATPLRILEVDEAAWHAHGRLTCAEAKAVANEGIERIVLPALARLRQRSPESLFLRPETTIAMTSSATSTSDE